MAQDEELTTYFYTNNKGNLIDPGVSFLFTELTQENRQGLVQQSSLDTNSAYVDLPTLELTALGANIELHGAWPISSANGSGNIVAWSEVGTGGRTMYAQIVQRGYLYPLGHKAIFTTVFQRVLAVSPANGGDDSGDYPVAYLQYQKYITVTEPIKYYPAEGQPFPVTPAGATTPLGTTDWPFQSVRMVTTKTPPLSAEPSFGTAEGVPSGQALWPQVTTGDVQWHFVATDLAGRDIPFTMPLVFVYGQGADYSSEFATGSSSLGDHMATAYNNVPSDGGDNASRYWSTQVGGSPMQFAPGPGGESPSAATTHPTLVIAVGAASTSDDHNTHGVAPPHPATESQLRSAFQPNFYPTISTTRVRLHAAEALTGAPLTDTPIASNPQPWGKIGGVQFDYFPGYVAGGTSNYGASDASAPSEAPDGVAPNPGSVYAAASNVGMSTPTTEGQSVPLGVPLNIPGNTVGGIGTPNLGITGLSAEAGAVGGTLANYASSGQTNLSEYFPSAASLGSATASQAVSSLLGGLTLGDILAGTGFKGAAPSVTSQTDPSTGQVTVTYSMTAPLASWPSEEPIFVPDDTTNGMMTLNTTVTPSLTPGGKPTFTTTGAIDPFSIFLIGQDSSLYFFMLHFESVSFTSGNGGKPTVVVNIDQSEFEGCLSFINQLSQFLQSLGLGGMTINVQPTSVSVSMNMSLPDIAMGMFTMTGLSFSGGVTIPFIDGVSTASFSFASQANPFTITVCCFGGGGFVALAVGFDGIQSVQAQFEFTGTLALDLYVASGSVSLSAGIYFAYYSDSDPGPMGSGVFLTGFVHLTGQVQILGILTVTATLQLSLSYSSDSGQVTGTASMSVSVSICGFGVSVGFSVTKTFAGGSGSSGGVDRGPRDRALAAGYQPPDLTFDQLMSESDFETYCSAFSN